MDKPTKIMAAGVVAGALVLHAAVDSDGKSRAVPNDMARMMTALANSTATTASFSGEVYISNGLPGSARARWADFAVPSMPKSGYIVP